MHYRCHCRDMVVSFSLSYHLNSQSVEECNKENHQMTYQIRKTNIQFLSVDLKWYTYKLRWCTKRTCNECEIMGKFLHFPKRSNNCNWNCKGEGFNNKNKSTWNGSHTTQVHLSEWLINERLTKLIHYNMIFKQENKATDESYDSYDAENILDCDFWGCRHLTNYAI